MKYTVRMLPDRCDGQRGRRDILHRILMESGNYRRTLRFKSRKQRLNYLIQLFKPYSTAVTRPEDKHALTNWLKKQGLTEQEVQRFYLETGIPNYRVLKRVLVKVFTAQKRPSLSQKSTDQLSS